MSIYGELDEAPTRSPLMEDASNRRALEEAEQEDTGRPARRAHTNQAHAIPQRGGTTRRGVSGGALAAIAAGGVFAFFLAISIFGRPMTPPAPAEQAPAVAPASPQQPAPPAPTTWAPAAAAEIPVGFTPGAADSAIAQGTPYTFLGGVEYVGGVAYCAIAVPHKDEGNVEHEARAWGACDALGIAPPPPPAAPVQAAPAPAYVPQSAPAPTERPASDMTPLPTDVPAGWHPPFAPGYDPGNYVTNPEARP